MQRRFHNNVYVSSYNCTSQTWRRARNNVSAVGTVPKTCRTVRIFRGVPGTAYRLARDDIPDSTARARRAKAATLPSSADQPLPVYFRPGHVVSSAVPLWRPATAGSTNPNVRRSRPPDSRLPGIRCTRTCERIAYPFSRFVVLHPGMFEMFFSIRGMGLIRRTRGKEKNTTASAHNTRVLLRFPRCPVIDKLRDLAASGAAQCANNTSAVHFCAKSRPGETDADRAADDWRPSLA